MPLSSVLRPSIQLGLLKATLLNSASDPSNVDDIYLNLSFAKQIGIDEHEIASSCSPVLLGEWLFSEHASGHVNPNYLELLEQFLADQFYEPDFITQFVNKMKMAQEKLVGEWLERVLCEYNWQKYDIIGFSCTYAQINSSMALAKKLKDKFPDTMIVFGGSSLEGHMGTEISEKCSFVDSVVQGEGEKAILELLEMQRIGKAPPKLFSSSSKVNFPDSPIPNYDSYYDVVRNDEKYRNLEQNNLGAIPVEASRGCWWGEKQHCKFCGLNQNQMRFRRKKSDKFIAELDELGQRYKRYDFYAVDNILDYEYFGSVLPELVRRKTSYRFFFEIKSNVTVDRMQLLKEAGVLFVQPGIESLSTPVLSLMRKGVTGTKNIEVLRWAQMLGIEAIWNIIYGFPGEAPEHYVEMLDLIPKLFHLPPPSGVGKLRLDRFSPYFEEQMNKENESSGNDPWFRNIRPIAAYGFCFPADWDLRKLAYSFDFDLPESAPHELYLQVENAVRRWKSLWSRPGDKPKLEFRNGIHYGHIVDSREGTSQVTELEGDHLIVARALCWPSETGLDGVTDLRKREVVEDFIREGFVVEPDGKPLWLPIPEKF